MLGYEMYRLLIKTKGVVAKPKRSAKKACAEPLVIDVEEEEFNKELVKGYLEIILEVACYFSCMVTAVCLLCGLCFH